MTQLILIIIAWMTAILAIPIHACLQLQSADNSIPWRGLCKASILIAACFGAVVVVGGLINSGWVGLIEGAVTFAFLSPALLIGGLIGRPIGWIVNGLVHRI